MTAVEILNKLPDDPLIKICEVRRFLKISKNTMYRYIAEGKIRKIPGTKYITRVEVERFIGVFTTPKTPEKRRRGRYGKNRISDGEATTKRR